MIEYTKYEKNLMTLINRAISLKLIPELLVNASGQPERITQVPLETPQLVNMWTKQLVTNTLDTFTLHLVTEQSQELYALVITRMGIPVSLSRINNGTPEQVYVFDATEDGDSVKEAAFELAVSNERIKNHMTRHVILHTQKNRNNKR